MSTRPATEMRPSSLTLRTVLLYAMTSIWGLNSGRKGDCPFVCSGKTFRRRSFSDMKCQTIKAMWYTSVTHVRSREPSTPAEPEQKTGVCVLQGLNPVLRLT